MFNTLVCRQDRLEEINLANEEKVKRLEEEVRTTSSNLSKVSEDLAIEKSLHVETAKVLEKVYVDLKEAKNCSSRSSRTATSCRRTSFEVNPGG